MSSPTSCTISGVDSDGSDGDLIAADNGNLILINSDGIITDVSAQFARGVTTTFENINNFIIAAGQIVNVLGTLIVKGKGIQIDGELNGTGGGYVGAGHTGGDGAEGGDHAGGRPGNCDGGFGKEGGVDWSVEMLESSDSCRLDSSNNNGKDGGENEN